LLLYTFLSLIILSCAEEDPNLVNAPPQTESIRVRLINFYSDGQGKTPSFKLVLDGKVETEITPHKMISPAIKPPSDSSVVSIKDINGNEVFKAARKLRFSRGNFYSVVYSKAYRTDTTGTKLVDTIAFVATLSNLPLKKDYSYLRMMNAVLDTLAIYSLRLGCPGGELLGSVGYLKATPQKLVYADKNQPISVSITKTKNNKTTTIGLFTIPLEELKQYMIIVYKSNPQDSLEKEKVYIMDEQDEGISIEELVSELGELTSKIRMINFTNNQIFFHKKTDSISQDLGGVAPFTISKYVDVPVCLGNAQDTIYYFEQNDTIRGTTALEVKQNYTVFSFDSLGIKKLLIAEPYRIKTNGKASVRVLNLAYGKPNLTLSIAANSIDTNSNLRYNSGFVIADNSIAGELSKSVLINTGKNIPITIFSAGESAQLQYTTLIDLESNSKYILVVFWNQDINDYQVFLIPEGSEEEMLVANNKGVFSQFVNLVPGFEYIRASMSNMLNNIRMYYSSSVSTVLTPGIHSFNINGKDTTFEIKADNNLLFVFAGEESQIDFFVYQYESIDVEYNSYKRRFINASEEIKLLNVKENKDDDNTAPFIEGLEYGKMSKLERKTLNKNVSLFFKNFQTGETVYRVDDLPFPFGKNYTIVFGGRKSDNSFSIVVVQEY